MKKHSCFTKARLNKNRPAALVALAMTVLFSFSGCGKVVEDGAIKITALPEDSIPLPLGSMVLRNSFTGSQFEPSVLNSINFRITKMAGGQLAGSVMSSSSFRLMGVSTGTE